MLQIGETKLVITTRHPVRKADLLSEELPESLRAEVEATGADGRGEVDLVVSREVHGFTDIRYQ